MKEAVRDTSRHGQGTVRLGEVRNASLSGQADDMVLFSTLLILSA
jgi:hypothetical protein